jgi:hypothetical protein
MQTQTQSQRIVSLIEYQAQRERSESTAAIVCAALIVPAAVCALIVMFFSL